MAVDRLTGSVLMRSLSISSAAGGHAVRRVVAAMTRHPVLSSFLVALGIRVVFAVSIPWTPDVYAGNNQEMPLVGNEVALMGKAARNGEHNPDSKGNQK